MSFFDSSPSVYSLSSYLGSSEDSQPRTPSPLHLGARAEAETKGDVPVGDATSYDGGDEYTHVGDANSPLPFVFEDEPLNAPLWSSFHESRASVQAKQGIANATRHGGDQRTPLTDVQPAVPVRPRYCGEPLFEDETVKAPRPRSLYASSYLVAEAHMDAADKGQAHRCRLLDILSNPRPRCPSPHMPSPPRRTPPELYYSSYLSDVDTGTDADWRSQKFPGGSSSMTVADSGYAYYSAPNEMKHIPSYASSESSHANHRYSRRCCEFGGEEPPMESRSWVGYGRIAETPCGRRNLMELIRQRRHKLLLEDLVLRCELMSLKMETEMRCQNRRMTWPLPDPPVRRSMYAHAGWF